MYLSGSKVIAILCITTAISSAIEVLTKVQQRNFIDNNSNINRNKNGNTSYELKVLNDFLDYNHLHRAIIIYTSSTTSISHRNKTQGCQDTDIMDNFKQLPLIRKLTENYHIQFVNTLAINDIDYLFQSLVPRIVLFMTYQMVNDRGMEIILKLFAMREKLNKSLVWFLIMEENMENPVMGIREKLEHLTLTIDVDITVAVYRNNSILDLYDIYKICSDCNLPLEVEYKGNWSTETRLTILQKFRYGIALRRNNFKNAPIKAATAILNKSPNLSLTDYDYLNNDKDFMEDDAMQRKTYQLLKLMENLFNFSFDIHYTNKWGAKENGSWTGVAGLLYNNQVEISLCPLRYLTTRLEAFVYSRNLHTEKIHFLFRHPKHSSIRNAFLEPLADIVWWCVLALIVVTILLLAIHVHMEYKLYIKLQRQSPPHLDGKNNNNNISSSSNNTMVNVTAGAGVESAAIQFHFHSDLMEEHHFDFIVLCVMETILMQGPAPELFRCNSTRLLLVSISIFSILLMQFYGAFIVSSLLSEPPRTLTNLPALYNSSLEMGMENVSYNYEIFVNSTNPLIQNIYKYRICNKHRKQHNIMTLEEGVHKIGEGNFAFHVAIDRAYRLLQTFLTESEFCDLQEVNFHPSFTFSSGVGIRKSSPYYEFVTLAIAMFQEAAILRYNDKKWEINKIDCTAIKSVTVEVDLEHFAPALVFLSFAILSSLFILMIEIIIKQIKMRKLCLSINK
ncbi:ionotropic receptor 84a [Cochliomyia hominivorax]